MTFFEYLCKKIKHSHMQGYSIEYSEEAKLLNKNRGGVLSSDEHSEMSALDFKDCFKTEDETIKWYFHYLENINHLSVVSTIGQMIKSGEAKKILSFGCGPAVNEWLLKKIYQTEITMIVTDYDRFIIEGVGKIWGDKMVTHTFDFYKDNPSDLINKYDVDTVIMIGSACSMDDKTYEHFLSKIRRSKVRNVLTFEAGVQKEWIRLFYPVGLIVKSLYLYLFRKEEYLRRVNYLENEASYHAFNRTVYELKKIYKKSGFSYKRIGPVRNIGYNTYVFSFLLK